MQRSIELNVRGNARICVPPSLELITPYVLLEQEDWFEDEIPFVRRLLRPGMHAVDVGASFGMYSMAMAMGVGAGGKVWSFEPTPDTADLLAATLQLNQAAHVVLTRAAVSNEPGSVRFGLGVQSELNAVLKTGETSAADVTVPTVTLDQFAAEHRLGGIDFVKLDVEGHEMEVFAGGHAFFATGSPLVMLEIKTHEAADLRQLAPFQAMGYEFYRLIPGLLLLAPFDPAEPLDPFALNLFACKPDRARILAADGLLAKGAAGPNTPVGSAWIDYLHSAPYAQSLAEGWPVKAGLFSAAGVKVYMEGLALFAQSRDPRLGAAMRLALLGRAAQRVAQALEEKDTLPRIVTFARLAWELGQRSAAVRALQQAVQRIDGEGTSVYGEPFVPPSLRYEQRATDAPPDQWVACDISEQWDRLRAFSSYYTGSTSLALLESMARLPYRSAEMERRRQLIRMRAGMQTGPEPNALVCERSEENLNPAYWCGAGHT